MGHRHLFSPSYMIETDNDQSWNLTEHPYMHTARTVTSETTSSIIYPDNMSIDGTQFSHCNHPQITTTYSSSLPQTLQIPNYQQIPVTPDLSMHTSSYIPHEDYRTQASSSSNYNGNPFNEDLFDIRNTRGHYKRKSPGVPDGTTNNGSSADVTMITEQPWQETPSSINFLHAPWDYGNNTTTNDYRSSNSSLLIGESSRNVRSRGTFDLESGSSRSHLTSNLSRDYFTTSRPMEVSPSVDLNGLNRNWNPPAHDNNSLNCEMNPFLEGSSNPNSSLQIGQQQQQQQQQNSNLVTRNNHALQNFQNTSSIQSVRGIRSNFSQRPGSTFRVSSSNLRLGHHTDEGLQLATNNNYSSRNQRPSSSTSSHSPTLGWHSSNNDRSGRARLSSERYRAFSGVNFHDRAQPEGLVIVDRSAFYGSRNPFDQHRDMRLDIDDMSYEELLALGERIGSVATGLPDHLISKCVQETIYCSSDQIQDECTCVICLEEYANMDDIGMLKACGHDFHVGCIRKWLSMKNVCPICKAEPVKQK